MKRALIIGSGPIENLELLTQQAFEHDFVVCADGGIRHTYDQDIHVDLVIGDLDSVDATFQAYVDKHHIPIEKHPVEKDATDTELAIDYCLQHGYTTLTLMGMSGGRMDHTLANIFLLRKIHQSGAKGHILDYKNVIHYVEDILEITPKKGYQVSIIPISLEGVEVSLNGFYYKLDHDSIHFGSSLGISNHIIEAMGIVHVHKGVALVIESKD